MGQKQFLSSNQPKIRTVFMIKLFTFLFHTFPLIMAWIYLIVAIICLFLHVKLARSKNKLSIKQWLYAIFNGVYILFFLITRIFFPTFWADFFGILGGLTIVVSSIWSRYEDKRAGRRGWNWWGLF